MRTIPLKERKTLIPFSPMITTGLALFSMFFGAGNLIFPIEMGKKTGIYALYGTLGLVLTGVLFTLVGLFAMIIYRGNHKAFFNRLGKIPGFLLSAFVFIVIGPLTGIPRSANVLYEISSHYLTALGHSDFIILFLILLFIVGHKRERVVPLLGYVVSPVLLSLLSYLIIKGYFISEAPVISGSSISWSFMKGAKEGYLTMDLLAAFHFGPLAVMHLKQEYKNNKMTLRSVTKAALGASVISCALLTIMYIGLSYIGSRYGNLINSSNPATLMHSVITHITPNSAPILHALVALAIFSTAIALTTIFSEFLYHDIFREEITYRQSVLLTLMLTGFTAHGGLYAILKFGKTMLFVCYPPLITLALANIGYKMWGIKSVKYPVLIAFTISLMRYLITHY